MDSITTNSKQTTDKAELNKGLSGITRIKIDDVPLKPVSLSLSTSGVELFVKMDEQFVSTSDKVKRTIKNLPSTKGRIFAADSLKKAKKLRKNSADKRSTLSEKSETKNTKFPGASDQHQRTGQCNTVVVRENMYTEANRTDESHGETTNKSHKDRTISTTNERKARQEILSKDTVNKELERNKKCKGITCDSIDEKHSGLASERLDEMQLYSDGEKNEEIYCRQCSKPCEKIDQHERIYRGQTITPYERINRTQNNKPSEGFERIQTTFPYNGIERLLVSLPYERIERKQNSLSREIRQTSLPYVGIETRQTSLPYEGIETRQTSSPYEGIETRQTSLPYEGIETRQTSLPYEGIETRQTSFPYEGIKTRQTSLPYEGIETRQTSLPYEGIETRQTCLPYELIDRRNSTLPCDIINRRHSILPYDIIDRRQNDLHSETRKWNENSVMWRLGNNKMTDGKQLHPVLETCEDEHRTTEEYIGHNEQLSQNVYEKDLDYETLDSDKVDHTFQALHLKPVTVFTDTHDGRSLVVGRNDRQANHETTACSTEWTQEDHTETYNEKGDDSRNGRKRRHQNSRKEQCDRLSNNTTKNANHWSPELTKSYFEESSPCTCQVKRCRNCYNTIQVTKDEKLKENIEEGTEERSVDLEVRESESILANNFQFQNPIDTVAANTFAKYTHQLRKDLKENYKQISCLVKSFNENLQERNKKEKDVDSNSIENESIKKDKQCTVM
ncbi:hypothetical protein Bpfe_000325 [Biomphalaria pfeifferi]|uniref:Uncharacterized protein n=1 Tax=Biomphalaria pfeifferi TaxID=112525 RepID=A0AAD8CD00_BIOPF|nr:hypothetical protein Bpfe_000325 [Biomphalaria pfeifferi]